MAQRIVNDLKIGHTPILPLTDFASRGNVWIKAEYLNPFGSVKDRSAAFLVAWALTTCGPKPRIVESTSGNLGIALGAVCDALNLPPPLVIVDSTLPLKKLDQLSQSRIDLVTVESPNSGMDFRATRIQMAEQRGRSLGHIWVDQYANDAGIQAHIETTAPEILSDPKGLDFVVCPISTGGTACGIGMVFSSVSEPAGVVAVEPAGSAIFGGPTRDYVTSGAGMHEPSGLTRRYGSFLAGHAKVSDVSAARACLEIQARYSHSLGLTTGAALICARHLAETNNANVLAIAPDGGRHYQEDIFRLTSDSSSFPAEDLSIELGPMHFD